MPNVCHMKLRMKHAPRLVVLAIDLMVCAVAVVVAYALRFDFQILDAYYGHHIPWVLAIVLSARLLTFLLFRTYRGLVRYTSSADAIRILGATTVGSILIYMASLLVRDSEVLEIPRSIILLEYIVTNFGLIGSRMIFKAIHAYTVRTVSQEPVMILGNEQSALQVKRTLDRDLGAGVSILGIVEPGVQHRGAKIEGIPIFPLHRLDHVLRDNQVGKLILTNDRMNEAERDRILDICLRRKVKVLSAPNVAKWLQGDITFDRVKQIDINDLLSRPPIVLNSEGIQEYLTGKTVLVTGAAGSIGSEIVRQISKFRPKLVVLFDQAETPLYDIDLELREALGFVDFHLVIGSMTDPVRMRETFEDYRPEVVFHAAAYKHVPMMEDNPYEAISNNVAGTKILTDLSVEFKVRRFVMVSTDKAVNPTNVMGASKRLCEIYVQAHAANGATRFITTRFGNVLGSNGSVVQRFKRQIENGGPVTITHPEIRRYFMTIPEACQLVLQAGTMGEGGEIYVFDMGKAEKIVDLAEKMIMLSGYVPNQDIRIVYVGLRPGEKLYEELLANEENTLPTHHPKILRAKVRDYEPGYVAEKIDELLGLLNEADDFAIVAKMKEIVPEFQSRNSRFEVLDHEPKEQNPSQSAKKG